MPCLASLNMNCGTLEFFTIEALIQVLEKTPSGITPVATASQSCTLPAVLIDGFDVHAWATYGRHKSKIASKVCKDLGRLKSLLATLELDMGVCKLKASHSKFIGCPMERNTGTAMSTEDLHFSDHDTLTYNDPWSNAKFPAQTVHTEDDSLGLPCCPWSSWKCRSSCLELEPSKNGETVFATVLETGGMEKIVGAPNGSLPEHDVAAAVKRTDVLVLTADNFSENKNGEKQSEDETKGEKKLAKNANEDVEQLGDEKEDNANSRDKRAGDETLFMLKGLNAEMAEFRKQEREQNAKTAEEQKHTAESLMAPLLKRQETLMAPLLKRQ